MAAVHRISSVVFLMTVTLLAVAACSKPREGNPYAEAKRSWDSTPPATVENALRNRLATTQRDN